MRNYQSDMIRRLPTIPQTLERLAVAHDVAKLAAALAVALPDSRRKRWLEAGLPIVEATRNLLHNHWVRNSWQRWDVHRSRSLYTMVLQHGEVLAHVGTENGTIRVYAVGRFAVAVEPHAWNELRADASYSELAAALLALASGAHPLMRIEQEADHEWSLKREPLPSTMLSSQVRNLRAEVRAEMEHGPRSILLHGKPGTGKSVAARQLSAGSEMTITVGGGAVSQSAVELAVSWRPSALVLEDIDHAIKANAEIAVGLLGQLEKAREHTRLIVVTANDISVLPEALRCRRGRIDHIVEVDRLDPALAQHIVPGLGKDAERAAAAGLTVADLEDLLVRCLAAPDRRAELVDQLISEHSNRRGG